MLIINRLHNYNNILRELYLAHNPSFVSGYVGIIRMQSREDITTTQFKETSFKSL